ncbi:RNase P/RNase MRP subunit POP5 [Ceraceosorus bombacis]|uniref:RNase P/RNase MRP subunit POP5 n=1 Tax=Ceraceosorus bombacis TaxID=401625 RepID=A0A0N7L9Z1_9BASI|nr:RNase P/RNase MRP subunit POP5 [Ceraceosorus bombacis]
MVRFKNRWLLLSISLEEGSSSSGGASSLDGGSLIRSLRRSLEDNFGSLSSSTLGASLACRYFNLKTGIAIVRCARLGSETVCASACLMAQIEGRKTKVCVKRCAGTIKKVQMEAIRISKREIAKESARQREKRREMDVRLRSFGEQEEEEDTGSADLLQPQQTQQSTTRAPVTGKDELTVEGFNMLQEAKKEIQAIRS